MRNVWEFIKNNEFEKACEEADLEYRQTGSSFPLYNKVIALIHLKKYDDVIKLINEIILLKKKAHPSFDLSSSSNFVNLGIANWFLGRYREAIDFWVEGEKCLYQDASGGVSLLAIEYFAAVRTNDSELKKEALKRIKKLLKKKRAINWPGPIGKYLLDEISRVELISQISATPILRERNLCQANFVIAIKELEKGNAIGYREKLIDCIKDGPLAYLESMYYLAQGEIEKIENFPFRPC